jgi:hypothetical protein
LLSSVTVTYDKSERKRAASTGHLGLAVA